MTARLSTASGLGTVGDCGPVGFVPVHRECSTAAPLVTVCVSVPMSADDLVALLWLMVFPDLNPADLTELETNPAFVHEMVCELFAAWGGSALDDARVAMLTTDDPAVHDAVARLYALVNRLYGHDRPLPTVPDQTRTDQTGATR